MPNKDRGRVPETSTADGLMAYDFSSASWLRQECLSRSHRRVVLLTETHETLHSIANMASDRLPSFISVY